VTLHRVEVPEVHRIGAEGFDLLVLPRGEQPAAFFGPGAGDAALDREGERLLILVRQLARVAPPQDFPQLKLRDVADGAPPGAGYPIDHAHSLEPPARRRLTWIKPPRRAAFPWRWRR